MRLDYRPAALLALKQHNEDSFADIEGVHKFPIAAQHSRELNFIEFSFAIASLLPHRSFRHHNLYALASLRNRTADAFSNAVR
jgi:hypothetical protein